MTKLNWWDSEHITFPRHMIVLDTDNNILKRGVMIYGTNGNKCHTIYGDFIKGDLRLPNREELSYISNATGGMALTEDEHKIMAIWRMEEQG